MNRAHTPALEGRWLFENRVDGAATMPGRVYRELRASNRRSRQENAERRRRSELLPSARRRQPDQRQETQGCGDDGSAEDAELDGVRSSAMNRAAMMDMPRFPSKEPPSGREGVNMAFYKGKNGVDATSSPAHLQDIAQLAGGHLLARL